MPVQRKAYLYLPHSSSLFRKNSCKENISVLPKSNLKSHLIMSKLRAEWEGASQGYTEWSLKIWLAGMGCRLDWTGM